MNKIIVSICVLLAGLGLVGVGYSLPHGATPEPIGAYRVTADHFSGGFYAGSTDQFSVSATGTVTTTGTLAPATYSTASIGSSSSSPAVLGSAASGSFVVAASATTGNASTTAVTINSKIFFTQSATTTIAGTTCNAVSASSSRVSVKTPGNGFQITVAPAPATNPYCFDYFIVN